MLNRAVKEGLVAPYVGAWIETFVNLPRITSLASHPMWVRGLKPDLELCVCGKNTSHPMWVRGLKQYKNGKWSKANCVAPYVGAWIETASTPCRSRPHQVAPYVGAWIETSSSVYICLG